CQKRATPIAPRLCMNRPLQSEIIHTVGHYNVALYMTISFETTKFRKSKQSVKVTPFIFYYARHTNGRLHVANLRNIFVIGKNW
ncbi:MAG: hypothetical protein IJ894_04040, partial [Bacteroidales bacterium]|nr:hypothetical protein [Bacteroidales bacterium]